IAIALQLTLSNDQEAIRRDAALVVQYLSIEAFASPSRFKELHDEKTHRPCFCRFILRDQLAPRPGVNLDRRVHGRTGEKGRKRLQRELRDLSWIGASQRRSRG